tara:strand:+ start:3138 stop:3794 length:657 start_codon:yes stop_codon:yes gene_type:complete
MAMEEQILGFFAQYAYEPLTVYGIIVVLMVLSSFGLPVPEEVTLLSAGLVAHMAAHPGEYPPPFEGAHGVQTLNVAIVAFMAVFLSDFLVFSLGKYFGPKIFASKFMKRLSPEAKDKIFKWTRKYGAFAGGIFRFTPGLRFPGHLACGMLGTKTWKFVTVDGIAALISVPTQVYLISYYGREILSTVREFKIWFFSALAIFIVIWAVKKLWTKRRANA